MKTRLAVLVLLMFLAMFAVVLRLKHEPNPVQKPDPAIAFKDGAGGSMDLIYTMPKGEHNNGWCSNDAQSWWPARADSRCYEEDEKYGTCAFPSVTEPWCNDGNGGADGPQTVLNQKINNGRKN